MTDWGLDDTALGTVFEERVVPVVFPQTATNRTPELIVALGQAGAGVARATRGLVADRDDDTAVLSTEGLRAFHPHYLELSRSRSAEASRILANAAARWMRDGLRFALEGRRSLLLEGTFPSASVALATVELFQGQGFTTRVAAIGVSRAASLLAEASRHLLAARDGRSAPFTDLATHDAGFEATRAVVSELEGDASVDRLTVVGRLGHV